VLRADAKKGSLGSENILKYLQLQMDKDLFLVYSGDVELVVRGFTDSSFAAPYNFCWKSVYMVTLKGNMVS
jgi:hypothetical protein